MNRFNKNDFSALDEYERKRSAEASAHMNEVLEKIKAENDTNNISSLDRYQEINHYIQTGKTNKSRFEEYGNYNSDTSVSPSYNYNDTSSRDYAYSRDARNQMDDMIRNYKSVQHQKSKYNEDAFSSRLYGNRYSYGKNKLYKVVIPVLFFVIAVIVLMILYSSGLFR